MEFMVDCSVLHNALAKTQGIIDRRTTSHVLSNVLMEVVDEGHVTITCTDFDVMWSGSIPAEITDRGAAATNGKQLFEAVRNFQDGRVLVRTGENSIKLVCGASSAEFPLVDHEDFPRHQDDPDVETFEIPKAILHKMIEATQFSISTDDARPSLNGAFLRVVRQGDGNGLHLTLVTTDGHRLSKTERTLEDAFYGQTPAEGIIHKKGVAELRRTLEGSDDTVRIAFLGNREILFKNDGGALKIRQIDARYPNYDKVIPSGSEHKVTLPREAFLQGLKLASSVAGPKAKLVQLAFEEGKVVVLGTHPDLGESRAEVPVDFAGTPVAIGFNQDYLLQIALAVDDASLAMEFSDPGGQVLFRSPSDPGILYVVMPMRV